MLLKSARCSWPAAFFAIATWGAAPLFGLGAGACAACPKASVPNAAQPTVMRTNNATTHAFMTTSCAREYIDNQVTSHKAQVTTLANSEMDRKVRLVTLCLCGSVARQCSVSRGLS